MSFFEDLRVRLRGFCENTVGAGVHLLLHCGAVCEGFKRVVSCTSERIELLFSDCSIELLGCGMRLSYVNENEAYVEGTIACVKVIQ